LYKNRVIFSVAKQIEDFWIGGADHKSLMEEMGQHYQLLKLTDLRTKSVKHGGVEMN
jgi:hypothetical protein